MLDVEIFLALGALHSKNRVLARNVPMLHIGEVSEFVINKFFDGRISLDFSVAVFKGSGGKFDALEDGIIGTATATLTLQIIVFGHCLELITSTANNSLGIAHIITGKLSRISTGANQE